MEQAALADSVELGRAGTMAYPLTMAIIGLVSDYAASHPAWVWALTAGSVIVGGLRRFHLARFDRYYDVDPRRYARVLTLGMFSALALWQAFACAAIVFYASDWVAMLALVVSVAITNAGAISVASRPRVARSFALVSMLPTVLCFALFAGHVGRVTALVCLVELAFTFAVIGRFARRFWSDQLSTFVLDKRGRQLDAAREEVARSSQAKARFLQIMSHELRTPLNGITGPVDLVLTRRDLDSNLVDDLRVVQRSAVRLERLIRRMLHFAALNRSEPQSCARAFDPVQAAAEVLEPLRERALERGLELRFDADDAAASVFADPEHLQTVLEELVTNAVMFSDSGVVEVSMSTTINHDQSGTLRLRVADTGTGIAPEEVERVFERFAVIDTSDARRSEGVGIGLAICRRLVDAAGGRIFVDSRVGKGTTITVLWPVELGDAASPPTPLRRRLELPCLVVDDNPVNRRVACKMLARLGLSCVEAADGTSAIELASNTTYQAIFMDLQMPGLDGYETTRRLRSEGGTQAAVPIIALTANVSDGVREACMAAGMNGYVPKPTTLDALDAALRAVGVVAGEPARRRAV